MAKLAVWPDTEALRQLGERELQPADENGIRTAVVDHFRQHGAELTVGVQLCTDLERMPVEDASVEWPGDESPYRPVARLVLPPQTALDTDREREIDENLLFCPTHSLAAHRPLGSIMRARMRAYEELGRKRRELNGRPIEEPRGSTARTGSPAPAT